MSNEKTTPAGEPAESKVVLSIPVASGTPAPVKEEGVSWSGNVAPMVIMKGGTTSSSYDQLMQAKEADANRRRDHQDTVRKMIEDDVDAGGGVGGFHEQKLVTQETPKLLLQYLNLDGSVYQECISEITGDFDPFGNSTNMMFTLVCPDCVARGLPQSECQIMVRDSHRKWFLDDKKRGIVPVETPWGTQVLNRAGTVTVQDVVKCSNYMCTWAANIDDSKVRRVSNKKGRLHPAKPSRGR